MNALRMNRSLEQISDKARALCEQMAAGEEPAAILRIARAMQVELTSERIVGGYRTDAINQVLRVRELIEEAGLAPETPQLFSIGMAAELAVRKIEAYRELLNFAAKAGTNGGDDDTVDRLAA